MPSTRTPLKRRAAHLVVAIDGPAGAGKSTVARGVARVLRIAHLDTGAMYRVITAKCLAEGVDPDDERAVTALARRTGIEYRAGAMYVDGRRPGPEIRSPRVNRWVSIVAAHRGVRRELVRLQRSIMRSTEIVAEGRDIGTVVFPEAPVKVFLTASIDERARRRHREMAEAGIEVPLARLKREIARRDALDSNRTVSPLAPAPDAVLVDSTGKTPRQVIAEIAAMARAVRSRAGEAGGAATRPTSKRPASRKVRS